MIEILPTELKITFASSVFFRTLLRTLNISWAFFGCKNVAKTGCPTSQHLVPSGYSFLFFVYVRSQKLRQLKFRRKNFGGKNFGEILRISAEIFFSVFQLMYTEIKS